MSGRPKITDEAHGDDFFAMLDAIARWKAAAQGVRENCVGDLPEAIAIIDAHFKGDGLMVNVEEILAFVSDDRRSLNSGASPYVNWDGNEETVCLDGHFTVEQLLAIAIHIRTCRADGPSPIEKLAAEIAGVMPDNEEIGLVTFDEAHILDELDMSQLPMIEATDRIVSHFSVKTNPDREAE